MAKIGFVRSWDLSRVGEKACLGVRWRGLLRGVGRARMRTVGAGPARPRPAPPGSTSVFAPRLTGTFSRSPALPAVPGVDVGEGEGAACWPRSPGGVLVVGRGSPRILMSRFVAC